VSTRKRIVETYIEGFRRTDHAQILSCLTDDVVWALHGDFVLCEVFSFTGNAISRLDTYHVWLGRRANG
jgi:hypothetical protein